MLPRQYRFPLRRFPEFFKKAKFTRQSWGGIYILQDNEKFFPRFSIIIKKSVGTAVERNAVKREARRLLFPFLTTLPARTYGIVFFRAPREIDWQNFENFWHKELENS